MSPVAIRKRRPDETERLFEIWRGAVEATHHFLTPKHAERIAALVREHYLPGADLWVAADEAGRAVAFMGLTGASVDSLFVDPVFHGRGIGRALIAHARALAGALTVDVNAQNEGAFAFYRRLGFAVVGRSETDASGLPYPLLHLRLTAAAGQADSAACQ